MPARPRTPRAACRTLLAAALAGTALAAAPLWLPPYYLIELCYAPEFAGIRVRWCRRRAFVILGTFMGLARGLYEQLDRQVTPEQSHWLFSAKLVLATILGGTRQFLGPVAGAFAFAALQHAALRFTLYHGPVTGVLLIVVVPACPGGVAGATIALAAKIRRLPAARAAPSS